MLQLHYYFCPIRRLVTAGLKSHIPPNWFKQINPSPRRYKTKQNKTKEITELTQLANSTVQWQPKWSKLIHEISRRLTTAKSLPLKKELREFVPLDFSLTFSPFHCRSWTTSLIISNKVWIITFHTVRVLESSVKNVASKSIQSP